MSPRDDRPAADRSDSETPDGEDAAPPDPNSFRVLVQDPGVRNYLFAGLAGLAMVFVTLFQKGTDPIGGSLVVAIGAVGLIFRWAAAPGIFLWILVWFLIFPFGLPPADENPFEVEAGRFRVADILLAVSVVVYIASHHRVFGLTTQAIPDDNVGPGRREKKPILRPPDLIRPGEIPRLVYLAVGAVLAGQLIWLFVTGLELNPDGEFPLRRVPDRLFRRGPRDGAPPWLSRFVLLTGIVFFGTLLARLVFGYWRLRVMTPAEGGMLLQDTAWNETRREEMRIARWRVWSWRRAAARAQTDRPDRSEQERPR